MGRRLRALRLDRGLTLRELAFAGCSTGHISRIERGERAPSRAVVVELARRLDVAPAEIAGRPLTAPVSEADLVDAEMAVRLRNADAQAAVEAALARARGTGDADAQSRLVELLGQLAAEDRRDADAVRHLEDARRVAATTPTPRTRPALYESLGRAYAGLGDLDRAITTLTAAYADAVEPPTAPALVLRFGLLLACAHTDRGDRHEAFRVLDELMPHAEHVGDPLTLARFEWSVARTHAEHGDTALAERYAHRVLATLERGQELGLVGRAHLLLASILLDEDRVADAERHLDRAAALADQAGSGDADRALIGYERARAALLADDLDTAEGAIRAALPLTRETEPGTQGMLLALLARVRLARDDLDGARSSVRHAVPLLEGDAPAHYLRAALRTLADAEERAGNLPAALAALKDVADMRASLAG